METKKKEQNTKAEAETFAATVKGMNRDEQLKPANQKPQRSTEQGPAQTGRRRTFPHDPKRYAGTK